MLVPYRETLFVIRVTRMNRISYFRIGENRDRRWKSPFAKFECRFQSILKRPAASLRNSKPKLFDPALKLAPINPIIRFDFSRLFCFVPSYIIIRMIV